jgi:hypothetical protein
MKILESLQTALLGVLSSTCMKALILDPDTVYVPADQSQRTGSRVVTAGSRGDQRALAPGPAAERCAVNAHD